jgi:hypothetical protein
MYMSESLWQDLTKKHELLQKKSLIEEVLELFESRNHAESLQHSVRLSNPLADYVDKPSQKTGELLKTYEETYDDLTKAWQFGLRKYDFPFDEKLVLDIAYLVEPSQFPEGKASYRRMGVRPGRNAMVTPPYPAKVPREMGKFYDDLEKLYDDCDKKQSADIVDISSWIHFNFVRIHPFEDGNGRIARILGNLPLIKNSFPPLVIEEGERQYYNKLLDTGVMGFNHREKKLAYERDELSAAEKDLYDWLATKINVSLDKILEGKK